jgi:hypothetical protein
VFGDGALLTLVLYIARSGTRLHQLGWRATAHPPTPFPILLHALISVPKCRGGRREHGWEGRVSPETLSLLLSPDSVLRDSPLTVTPLLIIARRTPGWSGTRNQGPQHLGGVQARPQAGLRHDRWVRTLDRERPGQSNVYSGLAVWSPCDAAALKLIWALPWLALCAQTGLACNPYAHGVHGAVPWLWCMTFSTSPHPLYVALQALCFW